MFVWGIDPGLSRCGYAVLESGSRGAELVALGVFKTPTDLSVPKRLGILARDVDALAGEFPPVEVGIERVLFSVNVNTAIPVAQAAGVIMAMAIGRGGEVEEYTPTAVKLAVTGDGRAEKGQVETMVCRLLGISGPIRPVDAADAAAVALCHLASAPMRQLTANALTATRRSHPTGSKIAGSKTAGSQSALSKSGLSKSGSYPRSSKIPALENGR